MSSATTITAAMVSRARIKGALFAVLSFPIMIPLVLIAISATSASISGNLEQNYWDSIKILIGYPVILTAVSTLLFDYVWRS
jgi:heme exporter protein B